MLGRLLFDRRVGAIAALLLASTLIFLRWAVESHPDLPQLFFLLVSLTFCCQITHRFTLRQVMLGGAFAGLAFGTKYAGIFLLPLLILALFVNSSLDGIRGT